MDGVFLATMVTSSVVVSGAIAGGAWKIWSEIGKQGKEIGYLKGEVSGVKETMTAMHNGQEGLLESYNQRIARLEDVENHRRVRKKKS